MIDPTRQNENPAMGLEPSEVLLEDLERIAGLGHYVLDFRTGRWSSSEFLDGIFGIGPAYDRSVEGWGLLIHPADRPQMLRYFAEEVFGAGRRFDREYRIVRPSDGAERWMHGYGRIEVDGRGKPLRMIGVIQDVTDRKRDEIEREALLEIMQGLVATPDSQAFLGLVHRAVARVIYAENFFVVVRSPRTRELKFLYMVDRRDQEAPPTDLGRSVSAYVLRTGETLFLTQELFEELRAQGEVDDVGSPSPSWLGAPLRKGQDVFGVMAVQDYETAGRFTERDRAFLSSAAAQVSVAIQRQEAEEALRDSEDRFRYIFENSVIAMSITTPGGSLTVNQAFADMLGHSRHELESLGLMAITHRDDRESTREAMDRMTSGESSRARFVKRYLHRDGRIVWADVCSALRRAGDGTPLYFVTAISDISDRVRAEEEIRTLNTELEDRVAARTEELEAAVQEIESFAYSVSHDLRAPVRAIDGFAGLLAEQARGILDAEGERLLATIRRNSARMGNLIDDLLDFSRTSRKEMKRVPVDMGRIASQVLGEVVPDPERGRIEIRVGELPPANGDPALVRVALHNLVSNAVKFSGRREDPVVEVGAREGPHGPEYFVRDNGVGFDPKYAGKLFGVFQRLHGINDFEGTGIGLALVKRIVERHGGRVRAEGELGKGATFSFTLGPGSRTRSGVAAGEPAAR